MGSRAEGLTPVSITATGTPLPVEYRQAVPMSSMVNPGAVSATFGSATATVPAQTLRWRIG